MSVPGDVSKRLISQIRSELNDESNTIIKTDDIIYRKLSFYQRDWSKRFKCIKVVIEYDLVTDQEVYPIDKKVVSINNISFYDPDGELLDWDIDKTVKITPLTKHEPRQIILNGSDEFESGQVMYADCYIQATDEDDISRTNDPIILDDYWDYLVKAVLSEYRYLRQDFMPIEYIEMRVKEIANMSLTVNRTTINNMNGLTF